MRRVLVRSGIAFAALAVIAWTGAYLSTPVAKDDLFVIAPGESASSVVMGLKDEGYVRSALFFRLALRESGFSTKLQPGSYDLSGARSFDDVISILTSGKPSAEEVVLRVIEGWTLRDIAAELERLGLATRDELYAVTGRPAVNAWVDPSASGIDLSEEFPFLAEKPSSVSLEGYLFPDTYRIYRDATARDIVEKLLGNFGDRVDARFRADIEASGRTLFEAVTMASVVEREARTDEDRRMVADIFWRRLDAGMGLESCATVNYVTGKDSPAVSYEDTQIDSLYNTYKYAGLPLGPIGNPGLSSLRAVADPEPNDYWFFLTDTEGNMHYARTLAEHNRNKSRYLK